MSSADGGGDGLTRRVATSEAGPGDELSNSKIESARNFLYDDEDENKSSSSRVGSFNNNNNNNNSKPPPSSSSTRGGGNPFPPPPTRSTGGMTTNLSGSVISGSLPYDNQNNNNNNNNNSHNNNNRRGINTFAYRGKKPLYATVVATILLGCIWGIVALSSNNNNNSGRGGQEHIHEKRVREFHTEILELELSSQADIETIGTPQYHAVQWMANVDMAKLKAKDTYAMHRYALAVLFYSTAGTDDHVNPNGNGQWIDQTNWLTKTGLCGWHGVICEGDLGDPDADHEDGFVRALDLSSNGLDGALPSELSVLELLYRMDLSKNGLTGTLPKTFSKLNKLRDLILRDNLLSGVIPIDYGIKLSNLRQLNLGVNQLKGSIPRQIEHMVNLRSLGLDRNQFEGHIPDLEDLSKLNKLYLDSNKLDGPFPASVAKLTALVELNLSKNHLTGFLPSELAKLTRLGK